MMERGLSSEEGGCVEVDGERKLRVVGGCLLPVVAWTEKREVKGWFGEEKEETRRRRRWRLRAGGSRWWLEDDAKGDVLVFRRVPRRGGEEEKGVTAW